MVSVNEYMQLSEHAQKKSSALGMSLNKKS